MTKKELVIIKNHIEGLQKAADANAIAARQYSICDDRHAKLMDDVASIHTEINAIRDLVKELGIHINFF